MRGRAIAGTIALIMIITACGGADSGDVTTAEADPPVSATTSGPVESATTTIPDDPGTTAPAETAVEENDAVVEESFATVTIGDQTWEFAPTGFMTERCDTNFFGGYWVLFEGVNILLPGERWEEQGVDQTPNVAVKLDDEGVEWVADPDTSLPGVAAGQSQIDSFQFDGGRASGTATFVEANAAYAGTVEPVTGTFEAFCAPEE
jgi:hypothetical protein